MKEIIVSELYMSEIITWLNCCHAVLESLCMKAADDDVERNSVDSFFGAADLLSSITQRLEEAINSAEEYQESAGEAERNREHDRERMAEYIIQKVRENKDIRKIRNIYLLVLHIGT